MDRLILAAVVLFAAIGPAGAQPDQPGRETGFMVHQMFVCSPEHVGAFNRLMDETSAPVLNDLQAKGMIRTWYFLSHAWGDEWNSGVVTIGDSHRAWLDFWAEYLKRLDAASPGWREKLAPLCTMHKDNMYTIRNGRSR